MKIIEQVNGYTFIYFLIKTAKLNILDLITKNIFVTKLNYFTVIKQLEDAVVTKTKDFEDLKKDFNSETTKLATKLTGMEKSFKEFRSKSNTTIEKCELKIQKLFMEKEMLGKILQGEQEKLATVENEKALLIQQLNKENTQKNNFEREYLQKCAMHNNLTSQYSEEILKNKIEITRLSEIVQKMEKENIMKCSGKCYLFFYYYNGIYLSMNSYLIYYQLFFKK